MQDKERIQALEDKVTKLVSVVEDLSGQFYKNNSSGTQIFNKDSIFNARLRVPVFTVTPTVAEVGDIIAVSGELYICTTASTGGAGAAWTVVGTQT